MWLRPPRASSARRRQMLAAFKAGELERDVVVVVRFQGPQRQWHARAAQADAAAGRLAGQGLQGGAGDGRAYERCLRQGARRHPCQPRGPGRRPAGASCAMATWCVWTPSPARLQALVDPRPNGPCPPDLQSLLGPRRGLEDNAHGLGRELFGGMRRNVTDRRTRRHHLVVMTHPRSACGASPSRGRRWWPGEAGSTAAT